MAIVVEDGTGVANANSYITLADALTLADNMGIPTPDMTESDLIQGMSEVHKYADQFKGTRTHEDQSVLADWPRTGAYRYGVLVDSDSIPGEVPVAQVVAAVSIHGGTEIFGTSDGRKVASEAVDGAVEVSYFEGGSLGDQTTIKQTQSILKPLMNQTAGVELIR